MCAPKFSQIKNENQSEPEVEEARVHSDIFEVLNNILRIIMENQEEDSDEEDEEAIVMPQAPIRSASGSLDGAPPEKRPREDSSQ